jgi:hypothetical protein
LRQALPPPALYQPQTPPAFARNVPRRRHRRRSRGDDDVHLAMHQLRCGVGDLRSTLREERAAFIRPETNRRRATASTEYRPYKDAFLLPPPSHHGWGWPGLSVAPPAAMSRALGEPVTAPLAAYGIACLSAFGAASLCRVGLRRRWRRLFLRIGLDRLRRRLIRRGGPAEDDGPVPMRSMVHDGRFIYLHSGAHGRAPSCGRLHNNSGHRDSAAYGCDNDAKKVHSLHAPQWLSLLRHRAGS